MDIDTAVVVGVALVIVATLGTLIGVNTTRDSFQKEAIEMGYAEYNKTTGEWQWIPQQPKTSK